MKKLVVSLLLFAGLVRVANAQSSEIYVKGGFAINGYDAVSYFAGQGPVKGNAQFAVDWKGAKWLFASQANATLFKNSPEKYAPQYGGYCAYGCSRGYKAKTSPDAWTLVNGKLYLNYDTDIRSRWDKDRANYIQKADANWPEVKNSKYP